MSVPSRRERRAEAVDSVLDQALAIMSEVGVAGLTMTQLARAVGIQPPSLYKYFPSALGVHDALFARGQRANLEALQAGMDAARPGLAALLAGMEATGRWAVANPVLAQLLFWRPVPGFEPSADAFAPAEEIIGLLRGAIREAVANGELIAEADSEQALIVLSTLHFGVISQHLANGGGASWARGRYTRVYRQVIGLFVNRYALSADQVRPGH